MSDNGFMGDALTAAKVDRRHQRILAQWMMRHLDTGEVLAELYQGGGEVEYRWIHRDKIAKNRANIIFPVYTARADRRTWLIDWIEQGNAEIVN